MKHLRLREDDAVIDECGLLLIQNLNIDGADPLTFIRAFWDFVHDNIGDHLDLGAECITGELKKSVLCKRAKLSRNGSDKSRLVWAPNGQVEHCNFQDFGIQAKYE